MNVIMELLGRFEEEKNKTKNRRRDGTTKIDKKLNDEMGEKRRNKSKKE